MFLAAYFAAPFRLKNFVLLAGSLFFYAWGERLFVLLFIGQCVSAWAFGFAIDKYRGRKLGAVFFYLSVCVSLSGLVVFKYTDFFIANLNALFNADIGLLALVLPVGVSFYTFQILSYTIDLRRGSIGLQKSLINFSAYVAMFPQLIAGPIVRYADVEKELKSRDHSWARFALGVRRFTVGLAKKVLLANVLGELVAEYKAVGDGSVLFAWLYMVAYALHIYFDFSGYSDMAIGLGHMFGFKFLENFNYPYAAKSVTDFWRRWHMSLSGWFRDYVYIPLGGSRVGQARHIFNILAVWLLTGFWHGADWNFIGWGLYFGALLLAEKWVSTRAKHVSTGHDREPRVDIASVADKTFEYKLATRAKHVSTGHDREPRVGIALRFASRAYVLLAVGISWLIFENAIPAIGQLFGVGASGLTGVASRYYFRSYLVPLALGVIACSPLPRKLAERIPAKAANILEPLAVAVLLITVAAFLADGSFNPFIYFRF